jgi:hypothetical protein
LPLLEQVMSEECQPFDEQRHAKYFLFCLVARTALYLNPMSDELDTPKSRSSMFLQIHDFFDLLFL